jgi:hypothetical protein
MRRFLEWLLSFFKQNKKVVAIESKIEEDKKKLEEIEDEEITDDDLNDYLND